MWIGRLTSLMRGKKERYRKEGCVCVGERVKIRVRKRTGSCQPRTEAGTRLEHPKKRRRKTKTEKKKDTKERIRKDTLTKEIISAYGSARRFVFGLLFTKHAMTFFFVVVLVISGTSLF